MLHCSRAQPPSGFHNVHFSSLRNETDRKIFPSTSHPHPLSSAHRGFKALLTQQWFEWFVYTVGLCLLVTIQSFLMAYWLSILAVPGISIYPLFMTPGLSTWMWASVWATITFWHQMDLPWLLWLVLDSCALKAKTESFSSNPTRKTALSLM